MPMSIVEPAPAAAVAVFRRPVPDEPPPPSDAPIVRVASSIAAVLPEERSQRLDALLSGTRPRDTVLRAGAGLLASIPFAIATGQASHASALSLVAAVLGVPVSLALVAVIGLSASTIGVSLLSSPLAPEQAADIGARGILRTGLVLLGLTPITALWVASGYPGLLGVLLPTAAWGIAGIVGMATLHRRLAGAVHAEPRDLGTGTVFVMLLLTIFTVVLGARLWISLLSVLADGVL
jgi:hypothetical protein